MQDILSDGKNIQDVAKYYKDMRDVRMTENVFHEGVLDVMKTCCMDSVEVLTDSAKKQLAGIDNDKQLSEEVRESMVRKIMDSKENFEEVKADFTVEKKEHFYDPSILSFAQLERPVADAITVSKSLSEARVIDLVESRLSGKLTYSFFGELREKYMAPSAILSKRSDGSFEEKEIKSSSQLFKWRGLILKDYFESKKEKSFVENLGTPSGSPEKAILDFKL